MIAVPTVKSFLGCVDLKVACIVFAAIRMVVSIIVLIVLAFVFLIMEDTAVKTHNSTLFNPNRRSFRFLQFLIAVYVLIAAVVIVINILATYWFIKGATSVKLY